MPSRAADIVNRMVDIIAYIDLKYDEQGNAIRNFITRRSPTVVAGSRIPYLDPVIPFSYEALIDAIGRAIDKQQEIDGVTVVDSKESQVAEVLNFNRVRDEAASLWKTLIARDEANAEVILKKIEMLMGHKMKLSEFTEDQVDLLNLAVMDMKELL